MSRKVFFSFHFKRDAWRAGQVRNCDLLADEDEYGVIDSVDWEKLEKEGDAAIEKWINDQLKYTSVTVALIGAETSERDWIDYEIRRSWERGNALLGLRIHQVKDQHGKTDARGANPLDQVRLVDGKTLSSVTRTYDWADDDGRNNLGAWVEDAFQVRTNYDGEEQLEELEATKTSSQSSRMSVSERNVGPTIIKNPPAPWSR